MLRISRLKSYGTGTAVGPKTLQCEYNPFIVACSCVVEVRVCTRACFMNRTVELQHAVNTTKYYTEQVTKCIFQMFLVCWGLICFPLYCYAEYIVGFFGRKRTARVTRFVYHRLEMGHRIFGALLRRLPWKLTVSACKVCLIVICLHSHFLAFITFSRSSL